MNTGRPSHAYDFNDLIVYQKSRALAQQIFEISRTFPHEETYSLTDQVRRASRSVGAQIAEAWAKRPYERSFLSKFADANGELYETQHWIDVAADCGYMTPATQSQLRDQCREIGRLIGGVMAKADQFCVPEKINLKEATAEYFTGNHNVDSEDADGTRAN